MRRQWTGGGKFPGGTIAMHARSFRSSGVSRVSLLLFAGVAFSQGPAHVESRPGHRAPFLNLSDPKSVVTRYSGDSAVARSIQSNQTRALSTAAGDFDEDGMPDLASGFATAGGGGAVTVHRGNVDALWPYGALRGTDPPAFLPDARVFALPEAADFLAVGDFDADGHWDIVAARSGSSALYLLKGDGHGGFAEAERIPLPGNVTAMTSGEINRPDGLTDLMVAVNRGSGAQALVFESPAGALRGEPETFELPADASALAVIPLDGGLMNGLAVAAGRHLMLIHGRDRKLTRSKAEREGAPAAVITRQALPFEMRSLAVGKFTGVAADLAALGDDGQIHILERSDAREQISIQEVELPGAGPAGRRRPRSRGTGGPMPITKAMNLSTSIGTPLSVSQAGGPGARLVSARVAATGRDSLIVIDPTGRRLHVVSHGNRKDGATMAVSASLDLGGGAPAAVEPMRINKDALLDLVVLTSQQTAPLVVATAPDYIAVVTNTADSGAGSLREAITAANLFPIDSMTAEVDFNIPLTDPNRDPNTGVFTIQPIYQNALQALTPLGGITLDGYTQPGASPNSLATGDNAHLLIEVNGSMAGLGPNGLELFGGVNVVRGLVVTNFLGRQDTNDKRYVDGGGGFDMESDSNIVEGNFIGIDAGGTFAKPNSGGIFTESSSFTSFGQTIGGTTPQARNVISGNTFSGIYAEEISYPNSFFIQNNYIGTDKTGTHPVPNGYSGIDVIGFNELTGGTAAGTGNLISSNGQFGVIEQVIGGSGNNVQGNLIGTDVTGAHSLTSSGFNNGVGQAAADGNLIGGTTPAARNIISGNPGSGIWFVAGAENVLIQGNYIGVDVAGSQAVPNGNFGISFGTDFTDVFGVFHSGVPVFTTTVGGEAAGAGNVISGNRGGGISIISKPAVVMNNVISGNLIGTDASGLNPVANQGDGILLQTSAASNTIGGTDAAAANLIAYNAGNGVKIDPGAPGAATFGISADSVIGNFIYSNSGSGVRIPSGKENRVSQNRIYSNGGLGIDVDAPGVQANSACQANTSGANALQNAPVLTAGAGTTFVTATATDPVGNTSEFSNCVAATLAGNLLTVAGAFSSTPSTTYTIEYFSNPSCDASGYGQGKVYLGSTTVTTNASCTAPLNNTLDLTKADLSVAYTSATSFNAITNESFAVVSLVSNAGPIAAAAVTWTDVLPAGYVFLSAIATQGSCSFAGGTITCNLGNVAAGGTVTVTAYVVPTSGANFSNTVTVASPTPDGSAANNSASFTKPLLYDPYLNHLSPASVYTGSPDTVITLVGQGFTPASTVTYGGVTYPATFIGGWNPTDCNSNLPAGDNYCTALTITIPAAQLTAVATVPINVVTTGITAGSQTLNFSIVAPPILPGPVTHFVLSTANPFPAGALEFLTVTAEDANNLQVPAYRGTVDLTTSDPAPTVFTAGGGTATVVFTAGDAGQHTAIISLQTVGTQSVTATDHANPAITGTLAGIVVSHGPASNLALTGTPQATPPGHAFALPLSVTVTDQYGNLVPNQLITFTPPTVGASAVLSSNTATTDVLGVASVTATANAIAGAYAVGVTFGPAIAGGGDNADVFLLTNGSGLATLTATAGTPQTSFIGIPFPTNLQATLKDGLGNPIVGATVYFTTGNVNGAAAIVTGSAVTNANGQASALANPPANSSPGTFPVYATAGGLTATFTLTSLTPNPVVITITDGSPQTTAVGTAFATPLAVHVADGLGVARPGVVVTYIPPGAAGVASATLSSGTASTDGSGNASLTATANNTLGTYNVTASVGGVTVDFVLTNGTGGSGPPASIVATAGTPQSQFVHQAFTTAFKVLVKDGTNTPMSGASVTFSAPAAGASGTFTGLATVLTNGAGVATAPTFTANTVSGSYLVTATAGNVSTTFSLTNLGGAPVSMSIYAGDQQSATIGTAYGTGLAVLLSDTYGNPVGPGWGNVSFILSPGGSGATGTFTGAASPSIAIDANGIATAPTLTANTTAGTFNVLAFFFYNTTFLNKTFTLTNTTSVPANIAAFSGTPQTANAGAAFAAALSAKVTDAGGNPLAGFTVTFTPPALGASALLSGLSAITNASGIATVTATANAAGGTYNVAAAIGGHTTNFVLTNVSSNRCDLNQDGSVTATDVQLMINQALGMASATDLSSDGVANGVDVQIVVNAALSLGCSAH